MKLVILDGFSINPGDLSWKPIEILGSLICHERTANKDLLKNISDADGIFVSKCSITKDIMEACPNLKFIGVTATGYDNIDINAASELGISVYNVPAYSTEAVAQHTFAMILEITNNIGMYSQSVKNGDWYKSKDFTYILSPLTLLAGKSLGIIGYGNIGKKVAEIGKAFGMKINIYSRDREATVKSDFVSLHCPATTENKGFINKSFISEMKNGAVLINTARGALINDSDLADALNSGKLAAAAVDVLSCEPPVKPHKLVEASNCIITPHIAWMPKEARQKVINICAENLNNYIHNINKNKIV